MDMIITKQKFGNEDYDHVGIRRNEIAKRLPISSDEKLVSLHREQELLRQKRVLGGQNSRHGMFPHQISLQVRNAKILLFGWFIFYFNNRQIRNRKPIFKF